MSIGEKIQFALVIVTCFSIIIPLIVQFFKCRIYRPKLSCKIDNTSEELFTECSLNTGDAISLKIRINNSGLKTAENVQVILYKVCFENKQKQDLPKFPPLKLYWSYQDDRKLYNLLPYTMKNIQPKSFEDCDFLFFDKQNKCGYFAAMNSKLLIKEYGCYKITFIISGDNFNSFEKTISFTFDPNDNFIKDLIQ
jgi:hypothetical protein